MRLYLVRHAEAVPRGTPGFSDDAKRPLTEEGHIQARLAGEALKLLRITPDLLLSSPYLRALQTAEHLSQVFSHKPLPVKEMDELRAEAEPPKTSAALKPFANANHVFLVGHEPHLSEWIAQLTAKEGMRCLMKKGGTACIEVEKVPPAQGSGTLRWLMTAKQLALIAKVK